MPFFARILGRRHNADPLPSAKYAKNKAAAITIESSDHRVACDGPEDGRHPRVFLEVKKKGQVYCPYCSRQFVYKA